ncbi:peptidoglycan bridge formation glycyltransferase FemA/FemB family protein [Candidatus Saccharibacteria bacterium]|nr:peptidoglycan bridge formation glycyltransferase FemA/FemB family protein [Candidatus Saccharibacteria bacterium]
MNFITLKPAEFTKFAEKSPYKSFLQTTEIAKLREKNGWIAYYFGVEENGKIKAAAMAVAKPTFLGKSLYSIPGGPLMDYEDTQLVDFFFKNLKKYAKSHNGYLLHIEPYYEIIERDKDGKIVENGFDHQKAIKNLKNLGFISVKPENPQYLFVLDLNNLKADELFASFKQNTRNLINRTARKGVKIRELNREELEKFKTITESTSERRHFTDKTLDYYETMYDLFTKKDQVKFVVAEIPKATESGVAADTTSSTGINGAAKTGSETEVISDSEGIRSVAARGRAPSAHGDGADGRGPKSRNNSVSNIAIAAAMFMTYGNEVIYLFSGSDEAYMKEYNAQYAIQWYMIEHAIKNKFKRYNFYGIQGLPDPKKPGYGIYKFKKGFGAKYGKVVELLGAYELPINPLFYHLHALLSKLKHH